MSERQEERLSPLPARALLACYRRDARMIGEGFREWFEAPSYKEGVGVDGEPAGSACRIGVVEKFLLR